MPAGQQEAPNPVTIMGYDPTTHLFVPIQVTSVLVDSFNQELYGSLPGGGGGGGGAVTAAAGAYVDGALITMGTKGDAAWDGIAASASEIQILKKLVAQLAAALSITGTVTETNSAAILAKYTSATGTPTSVVAAIASTQLLAANANRKGYTVFNESTATMYLARASAASLTAYTVQVGPNGFYEDPPLPIYTGPVFAIWSAANGNARITEMS